MSMIINGKTGLTGLLGSPVGHSKSPMMHNTSFQELGINYVYLCFDVGIEGLSGAVDGLVSLGAKGWNCTMPNKSKMAQLCDVLSPKWKAYWIQYGWNRLYESRKRSRIFDQG